MENENEPQIELAAGFELLFKHDLTTMVRRTNAGLDVLVCLDEDGSYHVEFGQSKRHISMQKIIAALPFRGQKITFDNYRAAVDHANNAIEIANA